MRRKFNPNAVASSDGVHCHISHDRKSGTTGRTIRTKIYAKCGLIKLLVTPRQAMMLAPIQKIAKL